MERKYYEAYDDRYCQVHKEKLQWFAHTPSKIVMETICKYEINKRDALLEIGCGEGRDAIFLMEQGYDLLATDISPEAVRFCKERYSRFASDFQVLDCITTGLNRSFDFIYAVAVVHMLVQQGDRNGFYRFVREHLSERGIALICSMGDGVSERCSDVSQAFALQERVHDQTGKRLQIAGTSYRAVSFAYFEEEILRNGLEILEQGVTAVMPDYGHMMYAVVKKSSS